VTGRNIPCLADLGLFAAGAGLGASFPASIVILRLDDSRKSLGSGKEKVGGEDSVRGRKEGRRQRRTSRRGSIGGVIR